MEVSLDSDDLPKEIPRAQNCCTADKNVDDEDNVHQKDGNDGSEEFPEVVKLDNIFSGYLNFTSGIQTSFLDFTSLSEDVRSSIVDSIVDHEKQGKNYKTLLQLLEDSKVSTLAPIAYEPVGNEQDDSGSSMLSAGASSKFDTNNSNILKPSQTLRYNFNANPTAAEKDIDQDERFTEIIEPVEDQVKTNDSEGKQKQQFQPNSVSSTSPLIECAPRDPIKHNRTTIEAKIGKYKNSKRNCKRKLNLRDPRNILEKQSILKKTRLISTRIANANKVAEEGGMQTVSSNETVSEDEVEYIEESCSGPMCCIQQCRNPVDSGCFTIATLIGNYQLKMSDENRVCEVHLKLDKDLHKVAQPLNYRKKLIRQPCIICSKMCRVYLGYPKGYCQKGVTSVAGIPALISCDSGCGYYEGETTFVRVRSPQDYVCVSCFDLVASRSHISHPVISFQAPSLHDPMCALYAALTSSCRDPDVVPSLEYIHSQHRLIVICSTRVQGHCNEKCIVLTVKPNFQVSAKYLEAQLKYSHVLPWYRNASELSQEILQIVAKMKALRACPGLFEEEFLSLASSRPEMLPVVKLCSDTWIQIANGKIVKCTVRSNGEQYSCQGTVPKHAKLRCTNCTRLKNDVLKPLLNRKQDKCDIGRNIDCLSEQEVRNKYYLLLKENREMRNVVRNIYKSEGSFGNVNEVVDECEEVL